MAGQSGRNVLASPASVLLIPGLMLTGMAWGQSYQGFCERHQKADTYWIIYSV